MGTRILGTCSSCCGGGEVTWDATMRLLPCEYEMALYANKPNYWYVYIKFLNAPVIRLNITNSNGDEWNVDTNCLNTSFCQNAMPLSLNIKYLNSNQDSSVASTLPKVSRTVSVFPNVRTMNVCFPIPFITNGVYHWTYADIRFPSIYYESFFLEYLYQIEFKYPLSDPYNTIETFSFTQNESISKKIIGNVTPL